jgi:hypothetical protein
MNKNNNTWFSIVGGILITISTLNAQITINEDISTDSLNLFGNVETSNKSAKVAMLLSAFLPAAGQQYLGREHSALVYMAVDLFTLAGAVFTERYSRKMDTDSRGYAGIYAEVRGVNKELTYWQAIAEFDKRDTYNEVMRLNRMTDKLYNDPEYYWKWTDQSFQDEYSLMRKKMQKYHTASAFFLGAFVLNRVVSIVNIRASTRYKGFQSNAAVKIEPIVSSDFKSTGLIFSTNF